MWQMPQMPSFDTDDWDAPLEEDICIDSYVERNQIKISEIDDSFPIDGLSQEDAETMHSAHRDFFR